MPLSGANGCFALPTDGVDQPRAQQAPAPRLEGAGLLLHRIFMSIFNTMLYSGAGAVSARNKPAGRREWVALDTPVSGGVARRKNIPFGRQPGVPRGSSFGSGLAKVQKTVECSVRGKK